MTDPARLVGDAIVLHGLASAHGHAFQRALRGRTHTRRAAHGGSESFWSWRERMYALASRLDPDSLYALARLAYAEMALAGYTLLGEFHYLHHGPDGTPYRDRVVMADALIRAARDVGLRIGLLRTLYARDGPGRPPTGVQRRFCDPSLDEALADVETLRARWRGDPCVRIGIAPHSVRAVPRAWIEQAASFARSQRLPVHAHVSEQPREVLECVAEHGRRPVELLDETGALEAGLVAVHAIHLSEAEIALLGSRRTIVCVCRTTERDLGDGSPPVGPLRAAGSRVCVGADSHAIVDPFEEARAVELDERTRTGTRCAAADGSDLLEALGPTGYEALGFDGAHAHDSVELDGNDPSIAPCTDADLADRVVFGAGARAVRAVRIAGREIVRDGCFEEWHDVVREARRHLTRLFEA
ncbi:MAG: formimidoylglutamate deiminase [Myxococcota bacterium]|nr:formimidoylglutamate deiminase [Myxococcota bacterium]MDW8362943.1 formimidoylglutamate deiminase [Myxococcales bacterium]